MATTVAVEVRAQTIVSLYWDTNGATSGAGGKQPAGTWDQNSTANWTTSSGGTTATSKWQTAVGTDLGGAIFSAGTGATGTFTVTVGGNVTRVGGISFEEGTVTLSGGNLILGTNATINTNANNAIINTTVLGGAYGIAKTGTGTLTIKSAQAYTGSTTISAGTLTVAATNALAASNTVVLDGGTLDLATNSSVNASNTVVTNASTIKSDKATATSAGITHTLGTLSIGTQSLSVASGGNVASNSAYGLTFGATTLTGNATFNVANNGTGTGTLTLGTVGESGTGSVTKSGTGTLVYTGANSYSGGTTLSSGAIIVNSGAQLAGATSGLTVNSGTLTLNNTAQTVSSLNGTGGSIALGSSHSFTVNDTTSDSFGGTFTGDSSTSITKTGSGTLSLSGASNSTFSGTVNVTQGTLIGSNSGSLGGSGAKVIVSTGGALGLSSGITTTVGNATLAGTGVNGSGALYNVTGSNTFAANTTVLSDTTISATTGQLTLTGSLGLDAAATGNSTVTFNASSGAGIIINGQMTDAQSVNYLLNIAQAGNGTVTIANGTNNYYGNTTIGTAGGTNTGSLAIGGNNALPTRLSTSGITIYSGSLDLNNFNAEAFGNITMGGGGAGSTAAITTGTGTLTLDHDIIYSSTNNPNGATVSGKVAMAAGTHFITVNDSSAATNDLTMSATLADGSGSAEIDKYGAGTLLLTGSNTYTGLTTVQQGILSVQNNNALGSTAGASSVSSGATMQLSSAANGNLTIGDRLTIAGSGLGGNGALQNVAGANTWTGGIVLSSTNSRIQTESGSSLTITTGGVNSNTGGSLEVGGGGTTTIGSSIGTGVTGINKTDAGTLILGGGNAFSGPITITGGTLSARSNTALATSNTATVSSGATLAFDNTGFGSNLVTQTGTVILNGTGVGGAGALHNTAGANQYNGSVNVASAATITANAATSLSITGTVSGSSGTTLTVGTATQNGSISISGALSGVNLVKNGSKSGSDGTLTVSGGGSIGTVNLNQGQMTVQSSTLNTGDFTAAAGTSLLIASGGTVNITGSATFNSNTLNGSAGTLQVNGANTLTFNGTINAPSLSLVLNGASVGTNAAPLTVHLSGSNVTLGTIIITGDTILDFGNSAGTALSSGALNIQTVNGAKVQVLNWVSVANNSMQSTVWYATSTVNSTTLGTTNQTPSTNSGLGQITFVAPTGSNGNTTTWVADTSSGWFDHEIRPTPEPATYGMILMSGCLGFLGWRRYQRRRANDSTEA